MAGTTPDDRRREPDPLTEWLMTHPITIGYIALVTTANLILNLIGVL